MPIHMKRIKKVKTVYFFTKSKSVFARWQQETPYVLSKCFEKDARKLKFYSFMDSKEDIIKTTKVLKKHYAELKNIFTIKIACSRCYPGIDWIEFLELCKEWKIVDQYLSLS